MLFLVPLSGSASAAPGDGSYIASVNNVGPQEQRVHVYSAAMEREIELLVWRPADTSTPAPTLYLLNGAGGGQDAASWTAQTKAHEFFADKHVNVVMPIGGKFSYYTDWRNPDPVLGVNEWRTFLTEEIPPLMDAHLGSTGANTIAGLSSSGTSVLQLAIAAPGLYRGVASYSGCAQTSDPIGQRYVRTTVEVWGQGDADNMWGPNSDPEWVAQDPVVHAEGLRGLALYISNGSGLPGPHDTLTDPGIDGNGAEAGEPGDPRRDHRGRHQLLHAQPAEPAQRTRYPRDLQLSRHRHAQLGVLGGRSARLLAAARRRHEHPGLGAPRSAYRP